MTTGIDRARDALFAIPPNLEREAWVRAGMAAKAADLSLEDFTTWSSSASNFAGERDCKSVWNSIDPNGGIGPGTLFAMAREAGWRDPEPHNNAKRERIVASNPKSKAPQLNAAAILDACEPATADQPYVKEKLGLPDNVRVYRGPLSIAGQSCDGALVLPARNLNGELCTLQFIFTEGEKLFLPGARLTLDACLIIGGLLDNADRIFIVEGVGQAWTAHQATRAAAVCCFGAGRMASVSKALRDKYPSAELVLVADRGKESRCAEIARTVRGAWCELPSDRPANFDLNDLHRETGSLKVVAELLAQTKKPDAPTAAHLLAGFWAYDVKVTTELRYVVKGIFGKGQIIVVWGAPGSGKSFNVTEINCCIGANVRWRGRRVRGGIVIHVVAESARPYIDNRIAALIQERPELARAAVFVIPLALDLLHTERGDVDRVIATAKNLAQHFGEVVLIAIDTLSVTFGGGDENSPADMGQYTSNIKQIVAETGAAVLIVHHCGKNEAAGMRGHTALLGALDAELAIEGEPGGQRILRTGKVREGTAYTDLFAFTLRVVELGTDQDGEAVSTCVVDSTDESGTRRARQRRKGAALGRHQKAVLRALETAGGRMARIDLAHILKDDGMPRNRVHDAVGGLIENGMLIAHNDCDPPEVSLQ
ncbi:MAG: AAA family ATPase [Betaproteobacteria bacterium]|nr:AAA family ATPase [Betaproteobacteria bacterium]